VVIDLNGSDASSVSEEREEARENEEEQSVGKREREDKSSEAEERAPQRCRWKLDSKTGGIYKAYDWDTSSEEEGDGSEEEGE